MILRFSLIYYVCISVDILNRAILRLLILKLTKRPLLTPALPEREYDPASVQMQSGSSSPTLVPSSTSSSPIMTPEHLKNNHVSLDLDNPLLNTPSALNCDTPVEQYLLPKALTTSSVKNPLALMSELSSPTDWLCEFVFILRPLIYGMFQPVIILILLTISFVTVWLLSKKPKSTNPLIVSLSLELFSRYLRRNPPASSALERNEYARRDRDLLWYFFRGSIWESYTRFVLVTFRVKKCGTNRLLKA